MWKAHGSLGTWSRNEEFFHIYIIYVSLQDTPKKCCWMLLKKPMSNPKLRDKPANPLMAFPGHRITDFEWFPRRRSFEVYVHSCVWHIHINYIYIYTHVYIYLMTQAVFFSSFFPGVFWHILWYLGWHIIRADFAFIFKSVTFQ